MKILKKLSAATLLLFTLSIPILAPLVVHAQGAPGTPTQVTSDPGTPQEQIDEANGRYTYIAPLTGYFSGTVDLRDDNALSDYLKKWVRFLIGIGGVIGVVRLVMVGFTIITSAEKVNAFSKVRSEMIAIVGGLGLIAGSWIFLNTLNPKLVTENLLIASSTAQAKFKLQLFDAATGAPVNPDGSPILNADGTIANPRVIREGINGKGWYFLTSTEKHYFWRGPFGDQRSCEDTLKALKDAPEPKELKIETKECSQIFGAAMSFAEQDARERLASQHIFTNKPSCPNAVATSCTNLAGLNDEILNKLINLGRQFTKQDNCTESNKWSCPVLVNGGTEPGHNTHGPNHPDVMDINKTPDLDLFLKTKAEYISRSFSNNVRYLYDDVWYTDESTPGASAHYTGAHFHICMNGNQTPGWWWCNKIASDGKTELDDRCIKNTSKNGGYVSGQLLCEGIKAPVLPKTEASDQGFPLY
ncbi:MAG TPA: hypothetical protein VJ579_01805 [Candidatus Paceibacterota bacterium]|nr:hypothetical protein [Candidatus Paceibacterota bacterium]